MNKHIVKRTCTKAAAFLLAALMISSACFSALMAEEMPVQEQTESVVVYDVGEGELSEEVIVFAEAVEEEPVETVTEETAAEPVKEMIEPVLVEEAGTETESETEPETEGVTEILPGTETVPEPESELSDIPEDSEPETEPVTEKPAEELTTVPEGETTGIIQEEETTVPEEPAVSEEGIPTEEETTAAEAKETEEETLPEKEKETEEEKETGAEDEEEKDPYGYETFDSSALAGLDFSSKRLIVATADAGIFVENESIIDSYGYIYLLQFEDVETAMKAYVYYLYKAEIVDIDTGIQICEGEAAEDVATGTVMTEDENPLSELKEAVAGGRASYDVALIDTGANSPNVTGAVSMIGDSVADDNGHGTRMAEYITAENSSVSILSIKALGSDGKGDISAIIAAIEYAISQNVKVISLSASAYASSDNQILKEAVSQAAAAGIIFVGSAGNNGKNAAYYVPGNIDAALIIGAADEQGIRLDSSNYGNTVDYNVIASSTSEAAARMAGWLTAHPYSSLTEILNDGFVYETDYVPGEEDEDPEEEDDSFNADKTWPTQYSNSTSGITLNTYIEWSGMDAWWPDSNGFITRSAAWEAVGEVSSISSLKPGDVVVWAYGTTANWVNHIAIVTEVASDGSYCVTADGNCTTDTGLAIITRYDLSKSGDYYGKVLVWRNTVNGANIAKYVDMFTREMISSDDTSMKVQWSNINWCYCFVVAALLEVEPMEEYGSLTVTKDVSVPGGDIKISKTTTGSDSDKNVEFTFALRVTNSSGNVVSTAFSYTKSDGTTGTISGNGGTLKLKNGQNAVISGIPQGYGYTVTETANAAYTTTVSKNGAAFTAGSSVSGTIPAASSSQAFTFTVNIKDGQRNVSGLAVASGLTTNSNGDVTFTLTPGTSGSASKTLSNIPEGYTYTVTESAVSGWTTSPADLKRTRTIVANSTQTASFTNTYTPAQQTAAFSNARKTAYAEVRKTTSASDSVNQEVTGNSMYSQNFSGAEFSVWIYDANTGAWGSEKTYTTGTDGSFSITGLFVGDTVWITETKAPAGYLLPATDYQSVTLTEGLNTVTFKDAPVFTSELPEVKKVLYENGTGNTEKAVSGAVFMVEYYDNTSCSGKAVRTWYLKTDSEGKLNFTSSYLASGYSSSGLYTDENGNTALPLGSVKITEINAPAGYLPYKGTLQGVITQNSFGNAEFSWTTSSGGQVSIAADKTLTLGDEELAVVVDKIDAGTGRQLKGAVLQILDGETTVYEWTTDGKPKEIKEILLPSKTYILHEKEAPEDYKLAGDIQFSIDADGKISVLTEYVDTYVTEKGYLAIKMEDVKMVALPVTGGSGTTWLILIGLLLAAGGAGTVVYLKNKKNKGGKGSMKMLKRVFGVIAGILAAAMLTVPSFASGNIKVVSEVEDIHTYHVYQLLSGTNLGENILWDIHVAEDIPDTLWDELNVDKHERAATDIAHWLAQSMEEDTNGSFAVKVAKAVLAEETISVDAKFRSEEEIILDDGFYLVTSDDAQPMLVLIGNEEKLTINEKSSVPKMEKEIGEVSIDDIVVYGDAADTGIGKVVPYRLIGTLPSNYDVYEEYSYSFHDVFEPCLVIDPASVKVTIENADGETVSDITKYADITITDTTMDVVFENLKQAYLSYTTDDTVVVYYEVMITDNASIGSKSNDNHAWIEYTRSPTCDQLGKSEPDRCRLYTWELDLNKMASDTKEALQGAGFTIHDAKGRFVNTDGTLTYEMTEVSVWTTDENGHFSVPEVDSGQYTVTEIQTPEGYQTVGAFNVTIEADYLDENNVTITASSTGNLTEIEAVDAKAGITLVRVCDLPDNPPPQTGDNTHLILYAVLLAAGLIGFGTVIQQMIRKKPEKDR